LCVGGQTLTFGSPTARKYSRKRSQGQVLLGFLLFFIGRVGKNSYQLFLPCLPSTPAK
jgi:hypothetical protein